jgi:hypothetical protein
MENNLQEKVKQSIQNLVDKKSRIYLLVQDTKDNARASVRFIYEMADALKTNGFNPIILHEKNDYTGVSKWLDEKYMEIPHKSIEGQNLEVNPEDFIVLPEIFGFVMEQIKNLPCGKIILSQCYTYILETIQPGQNWAQFGFLKCITTSNIQKEYLERIMRQTTYDVLEPTISTEFEPRNLPPMPIIAVHTREQRDTVNLIKEFYLKFPQYRWFTFKDMRGMSEKEFAETLKECFLSVWIDDESSFGTYPLESMSCGVPVLGKIPNLRPSWLREDNGIWVTDKTLMADFVADFIMNWLEDNIKPELYVESKKTADLFKNKQSFEQNVVNLFEGYLNTRVESFENQLSKTEE